MVLVVFLCILSLFSVLTINPDVSPYTAPFSTLEKYFPPASITSASVTGTAVSDIPNFLKDFTPSKGFTLLKEFVSNNYLYLIIIAIVALILILAVYFHHRRVIQDEHLPLPQYPFSSKSSSKINPSSPGHKLQMSDVDEVNNYLSELHKKSLKINLPTAKKVLPQLKPVKVELPSPTIVPMPLKKVLWDKKLKEIDKKIAQLPRHPPRRIALKRWIKHFFTHPPEGMPEDITPALHKVTKVPINVASEKKPLLKLQFPKEIKTKAPLPELPPLPKPAKPLKPLKPLKQPPKKLTEDEKLAQELQDLDQKLSRM